MQTTKALAGRIDPIYVRKATFGRWLYRLLIVACTVAALGWWSIGTGVRRAALLSPGHVSSAHAMWETRCVACHDRDSFGGFRKTVSDESCLKCHAAAAHHPDQLLRTGDHRGNELALAVSDEHARLRAANCVACHIEHRGRGLLSRVPDSTCTRCHSNIIAALTPGATATVSGQVTAFNARGGHPWFGRELSDAKMPFPMPPAALDAAALVDRTVLRFNHSKHMTGDADPAHGKGDNCTICHDNANGRYMRPISYARDCQSCHPLTLPGGAVLPHVTMDMVGFQISRIDDYYRYWIYRLPADERAKRLGEKNQEQWAKDSAGQFRGSLTEWAGGLKVGSLPGAAALEQELIKLPDEVKLDPDTAGKNVRLVAAYVAFGMGSSSCLKCHDMKSVSPDATPTSAPSTTAGADDKSLAAGANLPPLLSTVPTGISTEPRRWFRNSRFDHQSHQSMSCVQCHSRARQSSDTRDVLSPNLNWKGPDNATHSCVDCHHPTTLENPGADASCIACHTFHDPSAPTDPGRMRLSRQ